jgi:hypothetical protein
MLSCALLWAVSLATPSVRFGPFRCALVQRVSSCLSPRLAPPRVSSTCNVRRRVGDGHEVVADANVKASKAAVQAFPGGDCIRRMLSRRSGPEPSDPAGHRRGADSNLNQWSSCLTFAGRPRPLDADDRTALVDCSLAIGRPMLTATTLSLFPRKTASPYSKPSRRRGGPGPARPGRHS